MWLPLRGGGAGCPPTVKCGRQGGGGTFIQILTIILMVIINDHTKRKMYESFISKIFAKKPLHLVLIEIPHLSFPTMYHDSSHDGPIDQAGHLGHNSSVCVVERN